jgi:hypothetical protein
MPTPQSRLLGFEIAEVNRSSTSTTAPPTLPPNWHVRHSEEDSMKSFLVLIST